MKRTIILLFGFFLLAGLPTERARAQEKTIRIGFPSIAFQELPLFAASKRGFFRTEGINVELVQIAGAPAVAALLSGDVDYITHNSRIIATAVRGGGVKSVFNYVAKPIYYLVTLPEIKQAKELHGRTVGVSSFGGAAYYITKQLLEFYGLNATKDVAIRALGQDSIRFSAMAGRTIQGTLLPPDFAVRSKEMGFNVLVYAGDIVDMPMGGLGTTDNLHPIQRAFIDEQAAQCGFCLSGVILTAKALLDKNPRATDQQIQQALSGVLCRCFVNVRMVNAIRRYAKAVSV